MFQTNSTFTASRPYSGAPEYGALGAWGIYEAQFDNGYGAPRFASQKRKKKASKITRSGIEKMLRKNRFLRDENADLARALGDKDLNEGKKTLLRLARLRDKMRLKAIAAAEGKTVRQIARTTRNTLIAIGTLGLARHWAKKNISKSRRKRAKVWNDKAHAADELLLYWKKQFVDITKKAAKKSPSALTVSEKILLELAGKKGDKLDALEQDGITSDMPTDVQDEKESAAEAQAEAEANAEAPEEESGEEEGLSGAQIFGYAALGFGAAFLPTVLRR